MAKSRWKVCLLELAAVLVCCGTGDAVRVRGQAGTDDLPAGGLYIPATGTVTGYRGYAGTLGVLTAAALVIPAGIISIIYLLYIHHCKDGSKDANEMITGGKYEWSEIDGNDVLLVNHLWSKTDGSLEEEADEEENTELLLEGTLFKDNHDSTEKLYEISRNGSSGDAGGIVSMNGQNVDAITPQREMLVQALKAPVEADCNRNLTNTAEVHIKDDSGPKATNHGMGQRQSPVAVKQKQARFTQAVNMNVVNQVHLELKLTDLDEDLNDSAPPTVSNGKEKYLSEVQLFLPGFKAEDGSRGRCIGDEINDIVIPR